MNSLAIVFGLITLGFIWWNLWCSIKIIKYLQSKGEKVSLFNSGIFVKGKIFMYLPLYKKLSFEIDGKIGPLYVTFYVTFFSMLIFLIFGIAVIA